MKTYKNETSDVKYSVAHNDDDSVIHIGELAPTCEISTGLSNLEIYDTEQEVVDLYGEVAERQLHPEDYMDE